MTTNQVQSIAEVAVMYATHGWAVFPIWWITEDGRCACGRTDLHTVDPVTGKPAGSPGKHPITKKGVEDASRDVAVVTNWWTRHPKANIGLPAGANRLAIIDVDLDKPGAQLNFDRLADWAASKDIDLKATLMQRTGGGGFHLFFAAPENEHAPSCKSETCAGCIANGQGNKPPFGKSMTGLDTRGRGGYVIAAPSNHLSGREYEWVNPDAEPAPWPTLLSHLMRIAYRPLPKPARPVRAAGTGSDDRYAQAALNKEIAELRSTKEGGRNGALNDAAFSLGQLVGGGLLQQEVVEQELLAAGTAIGLGETETRKTIASGISAGLARPRVRREVSA